MLFSSCKNIHIAKQMPEETGLHSGCKHASNPYHVCSEYCFNFVADPKKLVAKKDPAFVEAEKTGVNRDCRHSSNPYHVCSEFCFEVISEPKKSAAKTEPAGLKSETRNSQPTSISTAASVQAEMTGVNRDCKYSSNPYHVCSEFCFEVISEPKKSTTKTEPAGLKSETRNSQPTSISTAASVQAEMTGVNQDCKYSSNPYHVCSEFCFEVISEPKKSTAKNEPASVEAEKTGINRDCRHSSNPYHVCSEFCFEVISEPKKSAAINEPASVQAEIPGVNQDCRYSSNPYHVCSEYCFEVNSGTKKSTAKTEPGETRNSQPTSISTATSVQAEKTGVNRDCRHSSNPYHVCSEYCFEGTSVPKKSTAKNEPVGLKGETRSSQPTSISTAASVQAEKTGVHRDCRHSSNPYHVCSEYCFEGTPEPKKSTAKNETVGLKAGTKHSQSASISTASSVEAEKTGVNRDCKYSSNPYHICSEFCFEVIAEPKKSTAKKEQGRRSFRRNRKSVENGRLIKV